MVSLVLLCNASFSRLGRLEFEVSWPVDPVEVTDIVVEREPYATLVARFSWPKLGHPTFVLWYAVLPTGGSFSSVTDSCSRRDSKTRIAMAGREQG